MPISEYREQISINLPSDKYRTVLIYDELNVLIGNFVIGETIKNDSLFVITYNFGDTGILNTYEVSIVSITGVVDICNIQLEWNLLETVEGTIEMVNETFRFEFN